MYYIINGIYDYYTYHIIYENCIHINMDSPRIRDGYGL